jgi:predicted nucleic acid-binding protein
MPVYCDTNLLVRLYAEMPDSAQAVRRFEALRRNGKTRLPITWLHQLEMPNALQQLVFLARNGQGIRMTPERAALALADFDEDLAAGNGLTHSSVSAAELVREARELSLRHTANHGFRAYDIAHVTCAILLKCESFWSFDAKASKLAELEGLKVL